MRYVNWSRALMGALVLGTACGDATGPGNGSRYYQLASVNGQALPFIGPGAIITRADLLLRADGSFVLGASGGAGTFAGGTYRASNAVLTLVFPADGTYPSELSGTVSDDSVVVVTPLTGIFQPAGAELRSVYRRAQLVANPVAAAQFELASINDRGPPLIAIDDVQGTDRYVQRVLFDSLAFSDGLFYRRHKAVRGVLYINNRTDSLVAGGEWRNGGYYSAAAGRMILHPYNPAPEIDRASDTLTVEGNALVRTSTYAGAVILKERYAARP